MLNRDQLLANMLTRNSLLAFFIAHLQDEAKALRGWVSELRAAGFSTEQVAALVERAEGVEEWLKMLEGEREMPTEEKNDQS